MRFIINYSIWWYILTPLNYNESWGIIFRLKSFWMGCHYSDWNKRYCLNILPGFTIWWIVKGGKTPHKVL